MRITARVNRNSLAPDDRPPRTANPVFVDSAPGRNLPGAARTNRADVAAAMLDSIGDPGKLGKQMLRASAAQTG